MSATAEQVGVALVTALRKRDTSITLGKIARSDAAAALGIGSIVNTKLNAYGGSHEEEPYISWLASYNLVLERVVDGNGTYTLGSNTKHSMANDYINLGVAQITTDPDEALSFFNAASALFNDAHICFRMASKQYDRAAEICAEVNFSIP